MNATINLDAVAKSAKYGAARAKGRALFKLASDIDYGRAELEPGDVTAIAYRAMDIGIVRGAYVIYEKAMAKNITPKVIA